MVVPRRRDRLDFDSMGDVCNHLLSDPETLEFIAGRGPGGKACFVMLAPWADCRGYLFTGANLMFAGAMPEVFAAGVRDLSGFAKSLG